jgi:hypothetical protein
VETLRGLKKRSLAHRFQVVFKGKKRIEFDEILNKLMKFCYKPQIDDHEKRKQSCVELSIGEWYFQFYGSGKVNAFIKSRDDVFRVARFLQNLGFYLELDKVIPRPAYLWDVFESSPEHGILNSYPICHKIIKTMEIVFIKSLINLPQSRAYHMKWA